MVAVQLFLLFSVLRHYDALARIRCKEKRPLAHWDQRTPLSIPSDCDAGGKRRCSPIFLADTLRVALILRALIPVQGKSVNDFLWLKGGDEWETGD